ncbi:hypothetical protein Poly24_34600 [Rosistilla carotiformis]|uniref:Uncharacterized protein n=2 Tax=Rosistilla carotiformis TaxID=2528017 RepID=A0A518JW36_9BACT|nr:hypothetical protein Poly24_34600 [Rosistilla carotiformis]
MISTMHKSCVFFIAFQFCSLASFAYAVDNDCADFGSSSSCSSNLCCKSNSGFFAGAELTLLTPHSGSVTIAPLSSTAILPERDMGVGGRYWLGYRAETGLGFRSRYWHFDQDAAGGPLLDPSLTAQTWDAELTQLFTRGRYSFDLSGGVRWGEIDDQVAPVLTESFNGWGSTVALSASRQLGDGPFSLIGGARGSLLFGDHVVNILGAPISSSQEVMPVMELQLGGEYSQELWGTHAFARAAFETQLWELPPSALGLLDQNIGFVGVTFSTGVRF